ncbi:hypothetical protein MMC19_000898 [Ptychographa xylographoides]|nr:hypothetical protein [Ptychographa xylographoides]
MYTTHPIRSNNPTNPVEYRMTQLNGWKMTGNPDAFRQGATAFRNARDWAKGEREALIIAANNRVPGDRSLTMESSAEGRLSSSNETD